MPVVDFHLHCYDRPLRAPESFVAFMDRELAKAYGSFAKFLEQYGSAESYLRVLDDAGANYGVIPAGSGTLEEGLPDDGQGRLLGGGARATDRRHRRALRQEVLGRLRFARRAREPQRMAGSAPARAFSKNARAVSVGSGPTEEAYQDGRGVAAERVGEAPASALDLAGAGLAAELRHDLRHLRGARRPDRVALGLQAPGRIHRDLSAEPGQALLGGAPSGARLEEAEPLRGDDLGDREAVVQLDHVHVGGPDPSLAVGGGRGTLGRGHAGEVTLVAEQHPVGRRRGAQDPDRLAVLARHLFGRQDDRGAAVRERP